MVYVVKVGRNSRHGELVPSVTRYVEMADDEEGHEGQGRRYVSSVFSERYKGFDLSVEEAEKIEKLELPVTPEHEAGKPQGTVRVWSLSSVRIPVGNGFNELYEAAMKARGEFARRERELVNAVEEYMCTLGIVLDIGMIEVGYGHSFVEVHDVKLTCGLTSSEEIIDAYETMRKGPIA